MSADGEYVHDVSAVVDPPDVPALLRAALAGDEQGVAAIVSTCEPAALIMALCGWANTMLGGGDFDSAESYDAWLAWVQREMAGPGSAAAQ